MAAFRAHAVASETGESVYAVRIEMGRHRLTGDEPQSAGGLDLGPSPFELLAASLAECTAMTIRWYARGQGWALESVEVAVEYSKRQAAGSVTPVDVFEKTITIRGADLTDEQRAKLLSIAAQCPVQRTLEGTPVFTTALARRED